MLDTKGKILIIDRALAMRFVIYCKISFTYTKREGKKHPSVKLVGSPKPRNSKICY